jgi:hypothetical protein
MDHITGLSLLLALIGGGATGLVWLAYRWRHRNRDGQLELPLKKAHG